MNILWLNTELLHPLNEEQRTRTFHLLRELRREHSITYLTFDNGHDAADAVAGAGEYSTALVRVPTHIPAKRSLASYRDIARCVTSPLPYAVWRHCSAAMQRRIEEISRDDGIDVVICDALAPMVNVPTTLPIPTILFQHKVEAPAWYARSVLASDFLSKRYFVRQWYRMYDFERNQCRRVDHVIAVSPEDLAWFSVEYGARRVSVIPPGVDANFFQPSSAASAESGHIVFTGDLGQRRNEDAVSYFVGAILPRVRSLASGVKLSIVGRDTPEVDTPARLDPRVQLTGAVADVRPFLERAAIVVMPLRIGGGTRREILEAMAMARPVVSTTVGAEGLPVRDGEHLLIADTPEEFASAITRLLDDPHFARELGQRAASFVRSEFEWSVVAARFAEVCAELVGVPSDAAFANR